MEWDEHWRLGGGAYSLDVVFGLAPDLTVRLLTRI